MESNFDPLWYHVSGPGGPGGAKTQHVRSKRDPACRYISDGPAIVALAPIELDFIFKKVNLKESYSNCNKNSTINFLRKFVEINANRTSLIWIIFTPKRFMM